ncbi:ATP-binding protein [Saccharicrinis sp. GN24d3]|uniref:ATP-binding protein n=1 Tax=Saccharicrinis sp. GN24d3 TaxID=3458416 RepID=UPI004036CD16
MIDRILYNTINKEWDSGKVIIVLGPRQSGKTTLLSNLCKSKGEFLYLNGDDPEIRAILENAGEKKLRQIIGSFKTIFIDEAQRIKNIGLSAKIIHDQINDTRLLLSGSSALELSSSFNEPLTGRKWEYRLYPISWQEMVNTFGFLDARLQLDERLIYGMYPEVVSTPKQQERVIKSMAGSYLYKDLLQHDQIRKPELLDKLLMALAFQLGSEVNYNELSSMLRIDRATIEKYIDLLAKAFVIFKLPPFSRNLRNEIATSRKIYFYDNGIRNAIIGDFRPIELRNDMGALWENFIISELMKQYHYQDQDGRFYFWRTYQQQEIDLILETEAKYTAYEIKWNSRKKVKFPTTFTQNYLPCDTKVINPENFEDLLIN